MEMPVNALKRALSQGKLQLGIWASLASPATVAVMAGSGFDWVLLDAEHAPADLAETHGQLQAMAGSAATPVVRTPWNDAVMLKRYLDLGAQSFLVPMVQDAEEARRAVAATRYPPQGIRGVSVAMRANGYGRVAGYHHQANAEICVVVQLETRRALENLEAIAAVEGVDGLFVGPSDLAADMGHLADSGHPEVRAAIDGALRRICAARKAAGILAPAEADARHWIALGATFVAVGSDVGVLARGSEALAARFRG